MSQELISEHQIELPLSIFFDKLPEERKEALMQLRNLITNTITTPFEENISADMIHYVVPHSIYPKGYHCAPIQPLPFLSLASQKQHISLHFFGLLLFPEHLRWFQEEYAKRNIGKLNMGKGCIRFGNPKKIPYDLIQQLFQAITLDEFIERYESFRTKTGR